MDNNIIISNIKNHYSINSNVATPPAVLRNKITNKCALSVNEANVGYIVKHIFYYSNYFSVLEDHEFLHISQLNEDIIEKLNYDQSEYYIFKYNDKNAIDFCHFLYNLPTIKKLIFYSINAFKHLLHGLYVLNENNICFFDVSPTNIVYLEDYREKPVFRNFKYSLRIDKLDYAYISHMLHNMTDFTYQPLEIHILYYFVTHNMTTISSGFIEEMSQEFVENLSILRLFSDKYKSSYKEQCIHTMRKYINLSKQEIINDILERHSKWDVYGISMIFLHIFGSISRVFSLKDTAISKMAIALTKNLHPDSSMRMTLRETLSVCSRCLHEQSDWHFINQLDNHLLTTLLVEFQK